MKRFIKSYNAQLSQAKPVKKATGVARRSLLVAIPPTLITPHFAPKLAKAFEIPSDPAQLEAIRNSVFRNSGVRPALSSRTYAEQIAANYGNTVAFVESRLQGRKYEQLSNELVLAPFDILRQACFYLPWALLEEDDVTDGIRVQIAYNSLLEQIKAFDSFLLAAARLQVEDDQVVDAWVLLQRAFQIYFDSIPDRARAGLTLAAGPRAALAMAY